MTGEWDPHNAPAGWALHARPTDDTDTPDTDSDPTLALEPPPVPGRRFDHDRGVW